MCAVTTAPVAEARSVFAGLGYVVAGEGDEFSASREWKNVRVAALADETAVGEAPRPCASELTCYVVWAGRAEALSGVLAETADCESWAVIAVEGDGSYEVVRAPPCPVGAD